MVVRGEQIVDVDLQPGKAKGSVGYFTPIVGVKHVTTLDFARRTENGDTIFWVELDGPDSDNGTIYTQRFDGDNKTEFLGNAGIVGRPYTIAYDWLSKNMYIGNRVANNIQVNIGCRLT